MTICDDLRQSVLQAAIQGKLTKQLPEDGTAGDLLASIKAEKEQLIKEKKIKKEKPLAPIAEDEIPFDIPESWVWIRLASAFQLINGDRGKNYPSKDKLSEKGAIPFISAINMSDCTIKKMDCYLYPRPSMMHLEVENSIKMILCFAYAAHLENSANIRLNRELLHPLLLFFEK